MASIRLLPPGRGDSCAVAGGGNFEELTGAGDADCGDRDTGVATRRRAGVSIIAVGIRSGVTGDAPEAIGFPQDLQNLVSALASAPQLTQITMSSTAGRDAGAPPKGAAQLEQNFVPGRTGVPQDGQTLPGKAAGS